MFFLPGVIDDFINEVDFLPSPIIWSDRSSSQTTSNDGRTFSNAALQDPANRDLPAIPFDSSDSEDEDDSNGQLQKRNLFQSFHHNPSHVSRLSSANTSSLSIKSRTQSDSSKLNTRKRKPRNSISSNNSGVPSTNSNHSESSQQNRFMPITLSPDPKRNESAKISALLRRKNAVRVNGTRHDTTNDFGQSVTRPNLKLSIDFPSITSSSKTTSNSTSDSVVVVVYPMEHFSSTSVSHRGYDVPMIQPSVTQTSQSSVIHNDDNLDDQQNALETNNRPDPTPITQPLTLKMLSKPVLEKPPKAWRQYISDTLARNEFRLRRMELPDLMVQDKTRPETLPSRTTATPKAELRPQLQTLQEDNSSDVSTLLREAYIERQQALQTQLDKALAELRDVQAENKRLTSENQSQQRSISHLKIALDEAKHEQDNSLIQINNQLRVATSSLTLLNKEKMRWQDKFDSMHHKLNAAERQIRCLDHLTRHKLESRLEAGYSQPKRRGLLASIPSSTDVIEAMRGLNEEIYQTCVQFVESLERTAVSSTKQKPQVQKVLGDHLTAMIADQATKATSGYNMLLMQTVLEVFMTHWCSSIIEAFYPQQDSFADLLVQLSAQTTKTSESTAICGKQIKIIQSYDGVKFNEWAKDIINELGPFLAMAGLRMKTQCATLFLSKTLTLVELAYDLRTAMAEKDICGGLEIVIVPPDTPFQEKWMMDGHADPRKVDADLDDFVAGTTGIGLQRQVSETVDGEIQTRMEMELKPKVTLTRTLDVKEYSNRFRLLGPVTLI